MEGRFTTRRFLMRTYQPWSKRVGQTFQLIDGGGGGIRTPGGLAPTAVFKTAALNRSATPPALRFYRTLVEYPAPRRRGHINRITVRPGQRSVGPASRWLRVLLNLDLLGAGCLHCETSTPGKVRHD